MCPNETACILPINQIFLADLSDSNLARDGAVMAVDHSVAGFKCRCDDERRVRED
jgi:hypothetical protein